MLSGFLFSHSAVAGNSAISPIPKDVLASAVQSDVVCRSRSVAYYSIISPPLKISGYNSRMDNVDKVPNARLLNKFVEDMSAAAAFAVTAESTVARDDMLDALATWARAGALKNTKSCTQGGMLLSECTEWLKADGTDLSQTKDFSSVQMAVANLRRAYLIAVKDHARDTRADDHKVILRWFNYFQNRMKTPDKVYFGLQMGWHWPAIEAALLVGDIDKAKLYAMRVTNSLSRLILDDGSIKDRTTRGDRALFYHNSSINEIMITLEMLRATGALPPKEIEQRLHSAVSLFIEAVQDHSVIDQWAKQAKNARYKKGYQDWPFNWQNSSFGGSWWHIYPYRYPERAEAKWLANNVKSNAGSAFADEEAGVALGCIYRSAGPKEIDLIDQEIQLINNESLCMFALNSDQSDFSESDSRLRYVKMAKERGLNSEKCRNLLKDASN